MDGMGMFVSSIIYEDLIHPRWVFRADFWTSNTTVAPAKDGWKMILSFWGTAHFQGQLLVLGRVHSLSESGETMDSTFESKKGATNLQGWYRLIQYTMLWNTHVYMCTRHANITKSMYCISWSSICLLFIYWGMSWQTWRQMDFGCIHFWEAWARMSPTNPYKPPLFLNFLAETIISP